jgi:hypothetical protein
VPKQSKNDYFQSCWEQAQSVRQRKDFEWFINWSFYKGNQHLTIKNGNVTKKRGELFTLNKIWSTVRGVRNYALRNRPKAEVIPVDMIDGNTKQAVELGKYCNYLYENCGLAKKLKESLTHAMITSAGFWQVNWNSELSDGQGDIEVNVIDPYDLYIDPKAHDLKNAQYVILAVKRNLADLKKNKQYDQKLVNGLSPDSTDYASSFKQMLDEVEQNAITGNKENGQVLLKEYWYVKNGKVLVATIADDNYEHPLREQETDLDQLPFFCLHSDIQPLSLYGLGWVKPLIPIQKALNATIQSQLDYNRLMNKGKYKAKRQARIKVIDSEHGQIILTDDPNSLTQIPIAPMASQINTVEANLNSYLEDLGALQEATRGRMPTGARSGRALELLQIGDANTMSELVENVEQFLEDVYEYCLGLASRKISTIRNIVPLAESSGRQALKVTGTDGVEQDGVTKISQKNIVDVKIASYLADTSEGRREAVKNLAEIIPDLPPEIVLSAYEIGNIPDIVQKIKEQRVENAQLEVNKQQAMARGESGAGASDNQTQDANVGRYAANAAIQAILQGQEPRLERPPNQEYLDEIDGFIAKARERGITASTLQQIVNFRNQVAQQIG